MYDMRDIHWVSTKHVLIYLQGTIAYGIRYTSSGGAMLLGYVDSHWCGSIMDQKGTFRYYFILGITMISWSSRKKGTISHSTIEE